MIDNRNLALLLVLGTAVVVLLVAVPVDVAVASDGNQTDEKGDEISISPEVLDEEGEQVALVYFHSDLDANATKEATGESTEPVVDRLKEQAEASQHAIERYANRTAGLTVERHFWIANVAVVTVDHDRVDIESFGEIEGVETVGANFEVRIETAETERRSPMPTSRAAPDFLQPNLETTARTHSIESRTTGAETTYGLEQINAPDVWDTYSTRGDGVSIAVLDTGVNESHPDIDVTRWGDWNFDGSVRDTDPQDYDPDGHGTHVSGTVVGDDGSGTQIGVAPDADLHHGAIMTDCGSTCTGSGAQVFAGVQWAVENEADVVSMSIGGEGYQDAFIDLVRNAEAAGTVVIAAAGNTGEGTSTSPGNVYDGISVGATDNAQEVADFSSGETIVTDEAWSEPPDDWPESYVVPTVTAPGVNINSAMPGDDYGSKSGTSMATPHVAGGIGLLQAATSERLSVTELETALIQTAKHPDDSSDPDTRYGHGVVDVSAAVESVATEPSIEDYATEAGIVESDGVIDAFADWQAGEIDSELLVEVFVAWQRGDTVG